MAKKQKTQVKPRELSEIEQKEYKPYGSLPFNGLRGKIGEARSSFFSPHIMTDHSFGQIRTMSRVQYGGVGCTTLRAVAQKAWVINVCINHVLKKVKPFFKVTTDKNRRGFTIHKKNGDSFKKDDKEAERLEGFILKCGSYDDATRDNFVKYSMRVLRDLLTLDQMATENQYTNSGELCAFFAVDAGTIERVLPEYHDENKNPEGYRYMQIVEGTPAAAYTEDTMIFDFANPRTDIYHSLYGYSYVEQAIDLITSSIHTFAYNMGNFTENKIPKGMFLINGDVQQDTVDLITDCIAEIMSGGPANQWRVPVIPSGGKDQGIEWKEINGKNREMEFQAWLDYLTSGVVAMFGCSMDELGLQSQKSQAMFENGGGDRMAASKSLILGDILTFYESYLNRIVEKLNPDYVLEFVGYELADPKAEADLIKTKVESVQTLNEARVAMGLDELDNEWANIPMNVQAVQLYQSEKAQEQDGGGGEGEEGGDDDEDWANYDGESEDDEGDGTEENPESSDESPEETQKSLKKSIYWI